MNAANILVLQPAETTDGFNVRSRILLPSIVDVSSRREVKRKEKDLWRASLFVFKVSRTIYDAIYAVTNSLWNFLCWLGLEIAWDREAEGHLWFELGLVALREWIKD